ncbi:hypothetical protein DFH08DRAFT_1030954 [Mycena albidolilacea]|uniref:Uncharacterized protein n=1 Tax=Mycena albidolilacea TaxID=1033008 RepID=A0AAD7AJI1_9AGAR|nr:hypothetical protein DFH08DRAFT_1030954 [Mycena albidolilacea]
MPSAAAKPTSKSSKSKSSSTRAAKPAPVASKPPTHIQKPSRKAKDTKESDDSSDDSEPETVMQTCILGAWDLSVCSCLFLQGVLCAQFTNYMTLNKRNSALMKLFVAGLALLTALKNLQSLVGVFYGLKTYVDLHRTIMSIQNVSTFGYLEAGSNLWRKHWVWKTIQILETATAFYVQMFFGRRLWAISRNAYLVIICVALFLCGLVSGIVGIVEVLRNTLESSTRWVGPHLAFVLCGDLLLTGSIIFCLLVPTLTSMRPTRSNCNHPQLLTSGDTAGE